MCPYLHKKLRNEQKREEKTCYYQDTSLDIKNGIVDFRGDSDPERPFNWSLTRKWTIVTCIALMSFITPFASSIIAPAAEDILQDLQHPASPLLSTFIVSIFVLGYAMGPLLFAPLSEMYGRNPVYHICNIVFLISTIVCAISKSIGLLLAFRFFQGIGGSYILTVAPASIADLFSQDKRGLPVSIWALGPTIGPVIGPLCGGFITETIGWRWAFWIVCIAFATVAVVEAIVLKETFLPAILARKTRVLRKSFGNPDLQSALSSDISGSKVFKKSITRPMRIACQPIVLLLSLFNAFVYALLYLFLTAMPSAFMSAYGLSIGTSGLVYLGLGVGMALSLLTYGSYSDTVLRRNAKKRDGKLRPEDRLLLMVLTSFCIPIGLFIYGWTIFYRLFWFLPILGTAISGFGLLMIFTTVPAYLIDAFGVYSASANTVLTVLRSLAGALLPLAGPRLFSDLGQGWANSLLAFITLVFIPVPWLLYTYGEGIRQHPRLQINL